MSASLEQLIEAVRQRQAIYTECLAMLDRHDLARWCRILRMTSSEAAPLVEPGVGLIHIDGNHNRAKVEADLANYLPKLGPGGYLVVDDIGRTTIRPLYEDLKRRMRLVYQAQDVWGCLRNEPGLRNPYRLALLPRSESVPHGLRR